MTAPACTNYLVVGKISAPHGLQGAVRVQPLTDDPDRFQELKVCLLLAADEKVLGNVKIQSVRVQNGRSVLVQFQEYPDRTAAESLRGCLLAVERSQAVKLPADRWFVCDLIGCAVHDDQEGFLGILSDILQHSAQDVYVVHKPDEPDLLFPALKLILRKVDITGRRIDVHLPDGLFEVYRGRHD
ncbi:MAG: ribosome maturation factor RimM [Bacillota bacterium]|nr:ribosome maturation factor RimM [Bacillota bacterium]